GAVVGIDGGDAVLAGHEQSAVLVHRRDGAVVPVDQVPRPGWAEPLELQLVARVAVAATGRVRRVGVPVRPFAPPVPRPPRRPGPLPPGPRTARPPCGRSPRSTSSRTPASRPSLTRDSPATTSKR